MAERTTISQVVQLGKETTPGTSVAANKKLQSLMIETGIAAETTQFRPMGYKYRALTALGKESAHGRVSGYPTFGELVYPFASVLGDPGTPTADGTNGKKWEFKPQTSAPDTPITYTIEQGSSARAHKMTYGQFTDFTIGYTRSAGTLSGSLVGQRITDGVTLTASPTVVELIPVIPSYFDVTYDASFATLGTTKLTRVSSFEVAITNRFAPYWVIDSANTSFVQTIEVEPTATLKLKVQADAAGMGVLTDLRADTTKWIRLKALGPTIAGAMASQYRLQIDWAGQAIAPSDFADQDGIYAIEWTFVAVHDATFTSIGTNGGAFYVQVINATASL